MSLGNIECSDIYFTITTQLGTSTSIGFRENKCTVDNIKDYFNRNIPKDCYISGNDVYRIKRIKSVRDSNYNEESYRRAIEDERIKELMKKDQFLCEFFSSSSSRDLVIMKDNLRYITINPMNSYAKIIEISDSYITIKLLDSINSKIKKILDKNMNDFRAYMRAIYYDDTVDGERFVNKIIAFDIVCIE